MSQHIPAKRVNCRAKNFSSITSIDGFSLIELMIALVLGLLVSGGIVSLFISTGKTSKMQDALATMQENGRYAVTRLTADLRQLGGQYCDNTQTQGWFKTPNGVATYPGILVGINASGWSFPDTGGSLMPPSSFPIGKLYALSPETFAQGYRCTVGAGCVPSVPTPSGRDGIPAVGSGVSDRVMGTDVLTLRYQSGTGWPFTVSGSGTGTTITLNPEIVNGKTIDDKLSVGQGMAFQSGDLALVVSCGGGQVFKADVSGNSSAPNTGAVLKPTSGALIDASRFPPAVAGGSFDSRVFNFSRGFVTVTYYVGLVADPISNPDQPNRLIPVLYRKVNGGAPDEIVRGVERLDFLYGVQYKDGALRYLTADQVIANSNATNCVSDVPNQPTWAGCLWNSVHTIEAHMLLDTVTNVQGLTGADTAFCYSFDVNGDRQDCNSVANLTVPSSDPNAYTFAGNTSLKVGHMMRHEFVSLVAVRNRTH